MAVRLENLLGHVTGKVGKIILYERNGKLCIRSKPDKISVPPTPKQLYHRSAFAKVSTFLAPIRSEIEFGFSGIPGENSKRFGKALSLAVKRAVFPEEGIPILHPERIYTSAGDLLCPMDCQLQWETSQTLWVQWRPNSFEGNGQDGDRVFYVAYDPLSQRKWSVKEGGYRKNGSLKINFPWSTALPGKFYHYLSFYRITKKQLEFSDSICLGLF